MVRTYLLSSAEGFDLIEAKEVNIRRQQKGKGEPAGRVEVGEVPYVFCLVYT